MNKKLITFGLIALCALAYGQFTPPDAGETYDGVTSSDLTTTSNTLAAVDAVLDAKIIATSNAIPETTETTGLTMTVTNLHADGVSTNFMTFTNGLYVAFP